MVNKNVLRILKIWMIVIVLSMFVLPSIFAANEFQMEWNKTISHNETWVTINLNTFFLDPIVVATPEYSTTTQANGISTWIRNVTNSSFELRTSDENFNSQDNITVHYLVVERGSWTLPDTGIKIQGNSISTTKYGYQGNYDYCPTDGESVTFSPSFSNNPLVISTRGTDANPSVWSATIQSATGSSSTVSTGAMCIGLSRTKAGTATFTNPETIYWVALDEGNGTVSGSEYEILWNLDDTGDSGGNWINGYGDAKPFTESWSHTWTGAPNIILASQTSIGGGDGSWPVIYDTGNTGSIRMFVDESNERSHSGSESGGGFAFNHSSFVEVKAHMNWTLNEFDIGDQTVDEGNISSVTTVDAYKDNTNVEVKCVSGDCLTITSNWTSINISHGTSMNSINFTCNDSIVGKFSAIYGVNSSEFSTQDLLNVTCSIYQTYGNINVNLDSPNPLIVTQVMQNRTFTVKATVNCVGDLNTTCGNISAIVRYNKSTGDFGDGSDGILTVNALNTVVNTYTYFTGNELSGDATITVNDASGFSIGDEILIMQMQNGTGSGIAGNHEFAKISNKVGNVLTLNTNLENTYGSGTYNSASSVVTQVVRVPQYTDLTINSGASITASAWNGYRGGIVVFRANGVVNTTGYINVSEKGYRGGDCNGCGNSAWGDQGESNLGIGSGTLSANSCGGGGGYGPSGYSGEPGAGGGHATSGNDGVSTYTSIGGGVIGFANLTKIFFGGGAGGGGDDDGGSPSAEYSEGGGIVMIFSNTIVNGRVHSKGENAFGAGTISGVTGGGAGGSIYLFANNMSLTDINALGGASVDDGDDVGGSGGDGRVRLDYNTISGSSNPLSGFNGSVLGSVTMTEISTVFADTPFNTISSQPQSCSKMDRGDNCTLIWIVNATGNINSSHSIDVLFSSNVLRISSNETKNATINITDNVVPKITLHYPSNNLKIINNGTLEFIWEIDDDDLYLPCSLFVNEILKSTMNCSGTGNNSLNITLSRGNYNWSINVTDKDNNSINSATYNFTLIKDYSAKISKKIKSINTDQYMVEVETNNTAANSKLNHTELDFVDTTFTYGSFNILYNWTNATLGIITGDILGWNDILINSLSRTEINYSIVGVDNYYLRENYRLVLE